MARRSNGLFTGLIFLLAFLLLVALNPTKDEFIAWKSAGQAAASSRGQGSGLIGNIGKAVGGAVGSIQGTSYRRSNYAFCSVFTSPDKRTAYLGVAKLFIKLK